MKFNLIMLGVFCLLAGVRATEWTERNEKCFSCLDPFQTTHDDVHYCTDTKKCIYDETCTTAINKPTSCITDADKSEDSSACADVNNHIRTATPKTITVTLLADSFCYVTLTSATATFKATYTGSGSTGAVYHPTDDWDASTLQASETELDSATIGKNEIKVALVNHDPSAEATITVDVADPSVPDSWPERDNKCFSCLDPIQTDKTGVVYCTDTKKCIYGGTPSCTTPINKPASCITNANKTENSACGDVNSLILTKAAQSVPIILPADSFCYVTLRSATATFKATYTGSGSTGAVYHPTDDWDDSNLQASETELDSATIGEGEIKVALVNYDPSAEATITVEVADPFWTERNEKCFSCLDPFQTIHDDVHYCADSDKCIYYETSPTCTTPIDNPKSCITDASRAEESSACAAINSLKPSATPKTVTVTLPADSFCYVTLRSATATFKATYTGSGSTGAVYHPTDDWDDSSLQDPGALLNSTTRDQDDNKVALVNYDPFNSTKITIEVADPNVPDSTPWTERDNKCFSCLDPVQTDHTGVYYCTDTKTCISETLTLTCNAINTPASCITAASKPEDPACDEVNSLSLSATAKSTAITLPVDSFCAITLTGITPTLKFDYSGSVGIYYPVTDELDPKNLQTSGTLLEAAALGRILQGSGTRELKVMIVNFDPSNPVALSVEAADPSVADPDEGLSAGKIAGIVIGSTFFGFIIIAAFVWGFITLKKKNSSQKYRENPPESAKIEVKDKPIAHLNTEAVTLNKDF